MSEDLTHAEAHFAFGKNWADYAKTITVVQIGEAETELLRLLGGRRLDGKRFLDIGCGSGLHALAALRLGACEVVAVDLDVDSVETARAVLSQWQPDSRWQVKRASVFEMKPAEWGTYDIVYSWGVLHHTGDMARAIRCAASLVAPAGEFVFALYRRVWMDWFWRKEKRWYAKASPAAQKAARVIHGALFRVGLLLTGRNFSTYVADYKKQRGMDFRHDVHDWMGGWPYESISEKEVRAFMTELGFNPVRVFARKGRILGRNPGVFGSGCDEYVYRRIA